MNSMTAGEKMSRIAVIEYISLDGVIQGPGHAGEDTDGGFQRGGWTGPFMAEHGRYLSPLFQAAGGFLLGRRTYDIWARYWPTVTNESDQIARALNTRPKYVASATLEDPAWDGTTVLRDVPREVAKLREQPGDPILLMGSAAVAQSLMAHGLVDEYQLLVHPVVLGCGKKLFRDGGPALSLRLAGSTTTAGGLIVLTYQPC
jgi:dihydrofolate reductase